MQVWAKLENQILPILLLGVSLFIFGNMAGAEDAKGSKVKKTTIDFEDELVEGEFKKPELFYLLQRKQFNYKRLIKLRKDFIPEMKQTAEDIEDVDVEGGGK